jgi:hypothetical protein
VGFVERSRFVFVEDRLLLVHRFSCAFLNPLKSGCWESAAVMIMPFLLTVLVVMLDFVVNSKVGKVLLLSE